MDASQMKAFIQNFSFDDCRHGNQGFNRLLIQLFGYTGHGKSSFINSCKYVIDEVYRAHATVASSQDRPQTMSRSAYQLTTSITLVDNRGCVKMDRTETAEIYAQLGNFYDLNTRVTWHEGYEKLLQDLVEADIEDRSGDFIAPVFVYSATKTIAQDEIGDLKEILTKAKHITGILPAVVITHETSKHLPDIKEMFRRMGVQLIFPIENYTQRDNVKIRRKHEKILSCLVEIVKDVDFRMNEKRNPRQEMINRKTILHTFLLEQVKAEGQEDMAKAESGFRRREAEYKVRQQELEYKIKKKKKCTIL